MTAEHDSPRHTGRHVRKPRPDLPWRLRPRPPIDLRDGDTSRVAILVVGLTIGLIVGGLRGLIEPRSAARALLSVAMLIAGSGAATVIVFYINRPPYQ
jgi:hypothetical protein